MIHLRPVYFFLLLLNFMVWFTQCNKEEIYINGNLDEITFSVDTLLFDTVFTQRGSATYSFKIKNSSKNPILLDEVGLEMGSNSKFRINVDGIAGLIVNDVEILGKDSIYVFAEVTIDPDQPLSVSPFVIEENLNIKSGTASKKVLFQAVTLRVHVSQPLLICTNIVHVMQQKSQNLKDGQRLGFIWLLELLLLGLGF